MRVHPAIGKIGEMQTVPKLQALGLGPKGTNGTGEKTIEPRAFIPAMIAFFSTNMITILAGDSKVCIEFFESDTSESKQQIGESWLPWQNLYLESRPLCPLCAAPNATQVLRANTV
jgi:hypothetical protein